MEEIINTKVSTDQLEGFILEVQNILGRSIKLLIVDKSSGKVFTADLLYHLLSQKVKVLFQSIHDLYQYIQDCIENRIDLLKILPDGSLQVSQIHRKNRRSVVLPTVQGDQILFEKISRQSSRIVKRVDQLDMEARNQQQGLIQKIDRIAQKSVYKFMQTNWDTMMSVDEARSLNQRLKDQLKDQIAQLREELTNMVKLGRKQNGKKIPQIMDRLQEEGKPQYHQLKVEFNDQLARLRAVLANNEAFLKKQNENNTRQMLDALRKEIRTQQNKLKKEVKDELAELSEKTIDRTNSSKKENDGNTRQMLDVLRKEISTQHNNLKKEIKDQLARLNEKMIDKATSSKKENQSCGRQLLDRIKGEKQEWKKELKELENKTKIALEAIKETQERIKREWHNKLTEVQKKNKSGQEEAKKKQEQIQQEWMNKFAELDRGVTQKLVENLAKFQSWMRQQIKALVKNQFLSTMPLYIPTLATKNQLNLWSQSFNGYLYKIDTNSQGQITLQYAQDEMQKELQRYSKILRLNFPLEFEKKTSFEADTSLIEFKSNWKIDPKTRIIEKKNIQCRAKIVSKQELPKTGKFYFEVQCISMHAPRFGIATSSVRNQQSSLSSKQAITFDSTGHIIENGVATKKTEDLISNGDLVSVFVDKQKTQISWFLNHRFVVSAKLPDQFLTNPIYAVLDQWSSRAGNQYKCIE